MGHSRDFSHKQGRVGVCLMQAVFVPIIRSTCMHKTTCLYHLKRSNVLVLEGNVRREQQKDHVVPVR